MPLKCACVAVTKNEEKYIAEWISWQLSIGFDAIIIEDNLSTDRTKDEVNRFERIYDVRVVDSTDTTASYQKSAYTDAISRYGHEFDWMAFFDVDEFLVFERENIKTFLEKNETRSAFGVNWSFFGSSGLKVRQNGLVVDNFVFRSDLDFGPNRHVKSIVRPECVQSFLNGHVFETDKPYYNLDGEPIVWHSPGVIEGTPSYKTGKLNHYFTKTWQDWEKKLARGYPDLERKLSEFEAYDRNEVLDKVARQRSGRILDILYKVEVGCTESRKEEPVDNGHKFSTNNEPEKSPSDKELTMTAAFDPNRPDLGGNVLHGDINTFMPILWKFLIERFGISSMLDVGCGEGHAVKFFHRMGVHSHGIEGMRSNLKNAVIPIAHHDLLTGPYIMPVDLVWSCEVAEHIIEDKVDNFIDTLANGRVVAMTHAVPGQDGHHHVNCQTSEYWIQKMQTRGYSLVIGNQYFRDLATKEIYPTYFSTSGLVFVRGHS